MLLYAGPSAILAALVSTDSSLLHSLNSISSRLLVVPSFSISSSLEKQIIQFLLASRRAQLRVNTSAEHGRWPKIRSGVGSDSPSYG
jgi:hypothetical protein